MLLRNGDIREGFALLEEACNAGDSKACTILGVNLAEGGPNNKVYARAFLRKGCEADEPLSCERLGEMLRDGEGGDADPAAALPLFEKACRPSGFLARPAGRACHEVAIAYRDGRGVEQDLARAGSAFSSACGDGIEEACAELYIPMGDVQGSFRSRPSREQIMIWTFEGERVTVTSHTRQDQTVCSVSVTSPFAPYEHSFVIDRSITGHIKQADISEGSGSACSLELSSGSYSLNRAWEDASVCEEAPCRDALKLRIDSGRSQMLVPISSDEARQSPRAEMFQ